jgi:two-component system, NarL family, response regulator NreC
MDRPYFIVLADDHAMVRRGLKKIIEEDPELKVIAEVGDGLELLDYLKKNISSPDMVIMDIAMPNLGGLEATRRVKEQYPEIKVLILTMYNETEYMKQALTVGASGYLLKLEADTELFSAISTIRRGEIYICPLMRLFGY